MEVVCLFEMRKPSADKQLLVLLTLEASSMRGNGRQATLSMHNNLNT